MTATATANPDPDPDPGTGVATRPCRGDLAAVWVGIRTRSQVTFEEHTGMTQ